jgi:WD40 repeat protein
MSCPVYHSDPALPVRKRHRPQPLGRSIGWVVASIMLSVGGLSGCSNAYSSLSTDAEPSTIRPAAANPWQTAQLEHSFSASKSPVKALAFSPDGQILIGGSLNGDTNLWDVETGALIRSFTDRPSIQAIAVSDAPTQATQPPLIASGDYQGGIELHDLTTGELHLALEVPETVVQSVAFSPNGKNLASGHWNGTVQLWDVETGELVQTLTDHDYGVTVVAFAPTPADQPPLLISADYDGSIKLWRSNGTLMRTFTTARYPVFALAISPDGKTLVNGNGDGTIKSWTLPTGRYIQGFVGHLDAVTALAISPNGQTLASSSRDKTIKLWDLATGNLMQTLTEEQMDSIMSLAFSPDGEVLVSGDQQGMIQIWRRR